MKLSEKKCVPCSGGVPPLSKEEAARLVSELKGWHIVDDKRLQKSYKFKDFKEAMSFADRVAVVAETENHHPDLVIRWGEVKIELWTHKVDGLTENDFILASKIDEV